MKILSWILGAVIFVVLCIMAHSVRPSEFDPAKVGMWFSVVPPLLAVVLAFVTHNVFISLIASVVVGSFLIHLSKGAADLANWGNAFFEIVKIPYGILTDIWYLQTLAFIIFVLSLISVVIVSGGLKAVIDWVTEYAKTRNSTKWVTYVLGLLVFIDDYANTMLVGSSMRPLSDHHKISREKLAFIVDATSAPVAGLAFISTWVGYEIGLFKEVSQSLNLGKDGYSMFFDALGFRFYCIMMLIFIFINLILKKDFGPMAKAEKRALDKGEVLRSSGSETKSLSYSQEEPDKDARPMVRVAAIPIGFMFAALFLGLWWDGGGLDLMGDSPIAIFSLSNWKDVISASENNITVLWVSAAIGLVLAFLSALSFSHLKAKVVGGAALRGVKSSLLPIFILILAWSIKSVCDQLMTGTFLVASIGDDLSPLWFPCILFVVAGITAFTTGTSWGTMAILIPVAIPLAYQLDGAVYGIVTMMCLGAILDGAIWGDHCSPISDTTIMSSIATGCDHMDHVKTQIPYSVLVAIVALGGGYYMAANGTSSLVAIGIGSVVLLVAHLILNKVWAAKA